MTQVKPAADTGNPGDHELRACSVCGIDHGAQLYSKSQWKRGSKRRCTACCQTQDPGPASKKKRRKEEGHATEAAAVSYGIDEGKNAELWRVRWAAACATVRDEQKAREAKAK